MVKPASKTEMSLAFKNLEGEETHLNITKQNKSVFVLLERKIGSSFICSKTFLAYILTAFIPIILFYDNLLYYFCAIVGVSVIILFCCIVREETVVMVKSLGYQVTTKYVLGQSNLFIPADKVQSIFINEVILRNKVIHVLTILTKENHKKNVIPLFHNLKPRLYCLEIICKSLRDVKS